MYNILLKPFKSIFLKGKKKRILQLSIIKLNKKVKILNVF